MRAVQSGIRRLTLLAPEELMAEAKNLGAPYELVRLVAETGKLPVPNFAAGGIATPADAALMMQLGAEAVFVGSGIFKSKDPAPRAKADRARDDALAGREGRGRGVARAWARRCAASRSRRSPRASGCRRGAGDGGRIGVLALQGDFAAHAAAFRDAGAGAREVRRVSELDGLAGLVLPGGESTTLLNLMRDEPWFDALRAFHARGGVVSGTCAGAILLSRDVRPRQPSLGLLDAVIERNAYGRQVDSFEASSRRQRRSARSTRVFIRAPRFRALGPEVEVLARYDGEPVLVRQGRVVAATFHPELTGSRALHHYLARLAETKAPAPVRLVSRARARSTARRAARQG